MRPSVVGSLTSSICKAAIFESTSAGVRPGAAWRLVEVKAEGLSLWWRWNQERLRLAEARDGAYLLRTNLQGIDP